MDPLTLALLGGGSTIVGSLFGSSAQDKVNAARSQVLAAERGRQQGYDAEADKINAGSLQRYGNFGADQDVRAKQLSDFFRTPVVTPNTPNTIAALPPVRSDIVGREVALKSGQAQDYVNHQADTLGQLRSFGDLLGGIQRSQAEDATRVGQIGSFKKGSNAVAQLELDNANRAGNTERMWADIASGLGKVGLTAGLSGAFAPAAAAVGAPMNILPTVAQTTPTLPASIFATGGSPFLNYGRA